MLFGFISLTKDRTASSIWVLIGSQNKEEISEFCFFVFCFSNTLHSFHRLFFVLAALVDGELVCILSIDNKTFVRVDSSGGLHADKDKQICKAQKSKKKTRIFFSPYFAVFLLNKKISNLIINIGDHNQFIVRKKGDKLGLRSKKFNKYLSKSLMRSTFHFQILQVINFWHSFNQTNNQPTKQTTNKPTNQTSNQTSKQTTNQTSTKIVSTTKLTTKKNKKKKIMGPHETFEIHGHFLTVLSNLGEFCLSAPFKLLNWKKKNKK